jgi:hypothetical protein
MTEKKDGGPAHSLEMADAILRATKKKITNYAAPLIGRGALDAEAKQMLSWCNDITDAQDHLEDALLSEKAKP